MIGKLANKPPTQQSIFINSGINQNNNVTSVGLIYTQQFDNFRELLQKISGQYKRNQRKKQAELEAKKAEEEKAEKAKQLHGKEAVLQNKKNKKRNS